MFTGHEGRLMHWAEGYRATQHQDNGRTPHKEVHRAQCNKTNLAVTKNTHFHGLEIVLVLAEVHNKEEGHWQEDISL